MFNHSTDHYNMESKVIALLGIFTGSITFLNSNILMAVLVAFCTGGAATIGKLFIEWIDKKINNKKSTS